MTRIDKDEITDKNLDRLAEFLAGVTENAALADNIPNGAHLFHGSFNDPVLTQANIELATSILMEMTLGISEESPLIMLFEHQPGQRAVIDLASTERKQKAQALIEAFREQSKLEVQTEINDLLAA